MASNIYNHINQEMKFFEICLDMAKSHVEDVLLTLALVDEQRASIASIDGINREYLQELNRQLGKIFTELEAWEHTPQTTGPENDAAGC
jgi:hypothetical protein